MAERPEHLKTSVWWLIHLRKGAGAAAPVLCDVARTARDAGLRALALRGLRDIQASPTLALPAWRHALRDRSSKVRLTAQRLLREAGAAEEATP